METKEAAIALTALAQPSRLEVFRLLVRHGESGLSAGEISEALEIPKPTLSFHLKELTTAGLVDSERDGRSIIYRLHISGMQALMTFLTQDCCQGRPELCSPIAKNQNAKCC
ncbi:MAG: ArsR/SmtB family transcription factor [Akkermansiaceae bacterium]